MYLCRKHPDRRASVAYYFAPGAVFAAMAISRLERETLPRRDRPFALLIVGQPFPFFRLPCGMQAVFPPTCPRPLRINGPLPSTETCRTALVRSLPIPGGSPVSSLALSVSGQRVAMSLPPWELQEKVQNKTEDCRGCIYYSCYRPKVRPMTACCCCRSYRAVLLELHL